MKNRAIKPAGPD